MRMTKVAKNKATKVSTTIPETNSNTNALSQTPIEIALKIDKNGLTSLKNLYSFLELDPKNYSRWCKRNILDNPFATECIDYIPVRQTEERLNPKPTCEYKLTSDFVKQLSMTVKNERGQEARKYFIACEQGLKVAAQKLQSVTNNSTDEKLIKLLTSMDNRLSKLEEQTQSQPSIEATYKKPYNPWFAKMQKKYKLLEEYFDITRGQLYKNILWELENLYDIDTQQIQADYCYENNISSCYPLEPYEFTQKYRDMIEQIVNTNLIKYGIASESDPITSTKHITIFDTPITDNNNG